jgi:hypothetical protein
MKQINTWMRAGVSGLNRAAGLPELEGMGAGGESHKGIGGTDLT